MAGVACLSKNGIGKSRRSRSRASTSLRVFRCCKIHFAGFSEKRPSRVLPTMTEMTVMVLTLAVGPKHDIGAFPIVVAYIFRYKPSLTSIHARQRFPRPPSYVH